jgi:hypothetical protein
VFDAMSIRGRMYCSIHRNESSRNCQVEFKLISVLRPTRFALCVFHTIRSQNPDRAVVESKWSSRRSCVFDAMSIRVRMSLPT